MLLVFIYTSGTTGLPKAHDQRVEYAERIQHGLTKPKGALCA